MPSWPVHIAIARRLNKTLKLDDNFILGNIMPDVLNGFIIKDISHTINHKITHYSIKDNNYKKIDISNFLKKYQNKLDNPLILGYLVHLLTDEFFNIYTYKYHYVKKNDKNFAVLNDGSLNNEPTWKIKQHDFDYYGNYLIKNELFGNKINITDKTLSLVKELPFDITKKDIDIIICKVNNIITKEVKDNYKYKMFTEKELDKVLNDCLNYIMNFLNNDKK